MGMEIDEVVGRGVSRSAGGGGGGGRRHGGDIYIGSNGSNGRNGRNGCEFVGSDGGGSESNGCGNGKHAREPYEVCPKP